MNRRLFTLLSALSLLLFVAVAAFPLRPRAQESQMGKKPVPSGRHVVMLELAEAAQRRGQHFFYVRIHESIGPVERGEKYEEPLDDALGELGEVTGGGSQMGEGDTIEYCGVDVVVNERERGLRVIRECMRSRGAPANTVIEEYLPKYRELPL